MALSRYERSRLTGRGVPDFHYRSWVSPLVRDVVMTWGVGQGNAIGAGGD